MINLILIILGMVILVKGADTLISSSIKITKLIKVPAFIIGFFVISLGTSAPEAAIGIISGLEGINQITLGDVVGSNIVNLSLVLGITALVVPIDIDSSVTRREIPLFIGVGVLLVTLSLIGQELGRIDGLILFIGFVSFALITFLNTRRLNKKRNKYDKEMVKYIKDEKDFMTDFVEEKEDSKEKKDLPKVILFFIIGLIALIIGATLVVNNGVAIAHSFGLSESLIGLTIVAFGTSLPELVSSVVAVVKKEEDIAVGNLVGSSVFNILFVLAMTLMINPIPIENFSILIDMAVMIVLSILLFLFAFLFKKVSRPAGAILILYYLAYISYKIVGVYVG